MEIQQMRRMSLLGLGLFTALTANPVQAETAKTLHISQAIPLGDGLTGDSGWYGSIHPSVVFGPSFDAESEQTQIQLDPTTLPGGPVVPDVPVVPGGPVVPDVTDSVEVDDFGLSLETNTGFGISGALGYRFTRALRTELELGYNRNSAERLVIDGISLQSAVLPLPVDLPETKLDLDGQVETWNLMASGYYDIQTNSPFQPYLGGGIGIAKVSANGINADLPALLNRSIDLDDDGVSFIFQVKAGTAYQIGDRGSVSLGYRLQGLPGQSFEVDGIDFDAKTVLTHAVEFGGQYRF